MEDIFSRKSEQYFLKVVLVRFFPLILILSREKIDKISICTSNSVDFTTEVKILHCFD